MGELTALIVSLVTVIVVWLYHRELLRAKNLERELGEALLREHQKKNMEEVSEILSNVSDADAFNLAVQRGLEQMSKSKRDSGDQ